MPTTKRVATQEDIDAVAALAHEIWNQHFTPIIGQEQVDYMLGKFQSVPAISRQIQENGYEYYLVVDEDENAGYFALVADEDGHSTQLSKFYLKRTCRGRGIGRRVLAWVEQESVARGVHSRTLADSQQGQHRLDRLLPTRRVRDRRTDRDGHRERVRHGRLPDGEEGPLVRKSLQP